MSDYDVIIIGAGHNGLTAANVLAQQGKRVLITEKTNFPGGMATTRELFPGYQHSIGAWTFIVYRDEMAKALGLADFGFELTDQWASFCSFGEPEDVPFIAFNDLERTAQHLMEDHGTDTAMAVGGLYARLAQFAPYIDRSLHTEPPNIYRILAEQSDATTREQMAKLWFGSCMDTLREFFPDPTKNRTITGSMAAMTIDGTHLGPFTPGAGPSMTYHYLAGGVANSFRMPKGGVGAVSRALARRAEHLGAEIRYKAIVEELIIADGKATGVRLKGGETVSAPVVMSTVDARSTFIGLAGAEANLPGDFCRRIREIDYRNGYVQAHLTLDGEPEWTGHLEKYVAERHVASTMAYIPAPEYVSDAWQEYRDGKLPSNPAVYMYVPSLVDPTMAPEGKHTATIFMHYFPHSLPPDEHRTLKEAYVDRGLEVLSRFSPNLRDLITNRVVFTNDYFAKTFGITGGDFCHGLLHTGQVFDERPMTGWNQYATPIPGLYMAGSGCHPGPAVSSLPGWNAANLVLEVSDGPEARLHTDLEALAGTGV
jgi:phytoene dehydrogenase-like protein